MKVGYIRVSTKDQNTARQEVLMQEQGVDKVFIEKISGKVVNATRGRFSCRIVRYMIYYT